MIGKKDVEAEAEAPVPAAPAEAPACPATCPLRALAPETLAKLGSLDPALLDALLTLRPSTLRKLGRFL